MRSYLYSDLNGFINIDTLGSNKNFYYLVQKPVSINMSNFACKIAFYDTNNVLLYHRNDAFAHWLKPWKGINLVLWSKQGNVAYFYEYARNKIYESVFLNLKDNYCYRINEVEDNFAFVDSLHLKDREYDEEVVTKKMQDAGFKMHLLIVDKVTKRNLFGINKWHPKVND